MFLKRLEVNGFKSFAQKTIFEFGAGIVGVVGPNGSGKSNVIDAIRWLLGEREAKNLRGAKIEDLIFAGSTKKPRMSQAQVSLVFDNALGKLPVDFKEVVITRKVSRTGNSEYFINDAEVRLKDIIDFFSKIKLGTRGLTIIGQGSGDIFVKASPQERMMMVQEILGLREFQLKKAESQRKLKNTKINLEKIQAMIQEVGPRLRMLKRQTSRWEKRSEIEQRLQEVETHIFASKIHTLTHEAERITQPLPQHEEQLLNLKNQEQEEQRALYELEKSSLSSQNMRDIQEQKRVLFNKKSELERQLYRVEAELEHTHAQEKHGSISLDEAKRALQSVKSTLQQALEQGEFEGIKKLLRTALEHIEQLYETKQEKNNIPDNTHKRTQEKEELVQAVHAIEENIKSIEHQEQEVSHGFETFNTRYKEAFSKLEQTRGRIREVEERIERIRFDQEKNTYKQEELSNYIASVGGSYENFARHAHQNSFTPITSEQELAEKERESMRLRGEITSIGDIDESIIKEAQEVEAHYTHLTKESQDLEKASTDLFALIHELDEKITTQFHESFKKVNEEFNNFFRLMFGGGFGKMKVMQKEKTNTVIPEGEESTTPTTSMSEDEEKETQEEAFGIDIDLSIPQKKITSLEMLSGGEKSLVSLAVLFALISVSPPPFLVLDEVDSALDEKNSRRFSELIKTFASHTQFVVVTHNRVTMEAADILYGVTMDEGGGSKVLSLKMV